MNKVVFFLLLMAFSAFASITYTVDLDREGDASVTISLVDENETQVILPADATNFMIAGGEYTTTDSTALIKSGKTGITSFSFFSSLLTEKSGSQWTLSFNPPENSSISIFMPAYSTINNVTPVPIRIFSEDSRVQIDTDYAKRVIVNYKLEDQPAVKTDGLQIEYIVLGIAIVLAAVIVVLAMRREKPTAAKKEGPSLKMTAGKREMMETFNENDLKIVNILLGQEGKARRNELERKSEISKSSLAVALNRLERRKIIEMDRSATTHYIRLSDYFLRL
jgi:uncharacterized membrane protein